MVLLGLPTAFILELDFLHSAQLVALSVRPSIIIPSVIRTTLKAIPL